MSGINKATMNQAPTSGFYYHHPRHQYYLDGAKMTGTTTVLGVAGDKSNLIQWAANQGAAKALMEAASIDIAAFAKAVAGFKKLDTPACKQLDRVYPGFATARTAHLAIRDAAGDTGTAGHKLCEDYERARMAGGTLKVADYPPEVYKRARPYIDWYRANVVKTWFVERPMFSREHFVAGTPDGGFQLKDGRNLINDKKFKEYIYDPSPFWQMAAYRMYYEEMLADTTTPIKIDWGGGKVEEYTSPREYLKTFGAVGWDGAVIIRVGENDFEEMYCDTFEDDKADFLAALRLYRSLGAFKNRKATIAE